MLITDTCTILSVQSVANILNLTGTHPFPSRPVREDFPDTFVLELSLASSSGLDADWVATGLYKNT